MSDRKVMIIGLDGATFDLIDPLTACGRLPTLRRLLQNGIRARLKSTIPPATIPAWPTFMTGKSPGRHGVFDFFKRDENLRRELVSSRDIDGPTLWRLVSDHGGHCIVMNVPCTYPPEPIKGVLVSGMLTPRDGNYVSSPEMAARLDAWTGGYRINPRSKYVSSPFNRNELIRELREVTETQKNAFLKLLATQPWDLAMLMFRATDIIQHKLWHRPEDIAEMYEFMDQALAEIIAAAGDASIWLMSDHGFGPQEKLFHINTWLRDRGWLAARHRVQNTSPDIKTGLRAGHESIEHSSSLRWLLARLGLSRDRARMLLPKPIHSLLRRVFPHRLRRRIPGSSYEVDWSHTLVFSDSSFTQETQALRINLRGREPEGTVDPSGYEDLRDEIIQALKELRDPETGNRVVIEAYKGDELFAGPYADDAPDLVLQLREGYKMIGDFAARDFFSGLLPIGGCHRRDGILIAAGRDIASGIDLDELSIADLMPSLLHFMNLPVPTACDGQVHLGLFEPESEPAHRPVRFAEVTSTTYEKSESRAIDEEILSRLRSLGYID